MCLEGFRNEAEEVQQNLPQSWVEGIVGIFVIAKEGHNNPQFLHLTDWSAGRINSGLLADNADRPLQFLRIYCGKFAVMVEVLKRLGSAGILLEMGEY